MLINTSIKSSFNFLIYIIYISCYIKYYSPLYKLLAYSYLLKLSRLYLKRTHFDVYLYYI